MQDVCIEGDEDLCVRQVVGDIRVLGAGSFECCGLVADDGRVNDELLRLRVGRSEGLELRVQRGRWDRWDDNRHAFAAVCGEGFAEVGQLAFKGGPGDLIVSARRYARAVRIKEPEDFGLCVSGGTS